MALSLMLVATLPACNKTRSKPSVWDMYDVRHPVPADSRVPQSEAMRYKQYIDNDAYYTSPDATDIYNYDPD